MSEKLMDGKVAFKRTFPLIISLAVIIIIGVVAAVLSKEKPAPALTNPDDAFVTIGDYVVTNGTVYRNLKVGYGLTELQNMIDLDVLSSYYANVAEGDIDKAIDKAKYDNSSDQSMTDEQVAERKATLTQKEKDEIDEAFRDSQYLVGRREDEDIRDYFRLELAKKAYALEMFKKDIADFEKKAQDNNEEQKDYFTEAQYKAYFDANYKPDVTALVIKFDTEFEAKEMMKHLYPQDDNNDGVVDYYLGVQPDKASSKWVRYDSRNVDDFTVNLTNEQIYQAFIDLYNMVNRYYTGTGTDPIPASKYTISSTGITIDPSVETENKYVHVTYRYAELNKTNASLANKLFTEYGLDVLGTAPDEDSKPYYTDQIAKTHTINPATDSYSKYYLAIKLSMGAFKELDETVKAEIRPKLIEQGLTNTEINKQILKMRRDNGLVIYDNFLEKSYAQGDTSFKTTKKTSDNVVALYKVGDTTKNITADHLYEHLVNLYAPREIGNIVDRELLVRDTKYNDVYDIANDKVLNKDEYEKFKQTVISYRNAFAQDAFAQYGFPASYGWTNFIRENFGAENQKELLVSLSLYQYTLKKFAEESYDDAQVRAEMQKQVDEFFEANVMNLIIFVDYNNDNQPDKNIVGEVNTELAPWTQLQKNLAVELAAVVNTERSKIVTGSDQATAFNTVIERYNNALMNDPLWGKYKVAGLHLKYEATGTTNNQSQFVKEFLDATKALWGKEKDLGNLGHTTEPRWVSEAFQTSYGFHFIGISSTTDYTYAHKDTKIILPSQEEIDLYKREQESKETGGKALTEEEQAQIDEKLTTDVRAAITKYYTPAITALESSNGSNGRIDLKLYDYRKDMIFTNTDMKTNYEGVWDINEKMYNKANNQ